MVSRAAADRLDESDDLDWKRDLPQPPRNGQWNEFAKDISAMANTRGGLLIYGVADNHEIIGIDWEKADLRQYAQWVRNHVHPYLPDLVMYPLTDGATTLLVVDVPASEMAPHLVHGRSDKDKEQQAFTVPYRDRDHTAWMAEHQIERAYRDRFTRPTARRKRCAGTPTSSPGPSPRTPPSPPPGSSPSHVPPGPTLTVRPRSTGTKLATFFTLPRNEEGSFRRDGLPDR
ncbi:AlbA family DNA-binding domain-containing protein [Streptomyces sp. CB02115]|uniref:AlbA family DNA-binding domain-containing protein n=1 Tax=Streptomyces sp. CB02115 TaxID=1703939 RepID=UPI00093C0627|nr:ATP-binding protein [Streptomyces sp. CB02115]OKJ51630.1 hypothetical protein AMK28_24745 [Streptomyces sp. CB02115]